MKLACTLCGLLVAVAVVNANPIVKREANDLTPINEVFVLQPDADTEIVADDERGDRDKRKIGIVKLGVTNGIINFVFGKIDSFLDAKTKALAALDEGNKAKNVAFGIDNSQSATGQYISNLISQKIQAGTASIGPLVSGATTFFTAASSGLTNAIGSKIAPLAGLLGPLSSGSAGDGGAGGLGGGFGGILTSKIEALSGLSGGSSLGGGDGGASASAGASIGGANVGAGVNLGGGLGGGLNLGNFANIGASSVSTTTEDIPEFDRAHVSLDVPPPVFGSGFTLITNVSKVLSSVITNSARRTENILEIFKPVFRGAFAIKGLPSDRVQKKRDTPGLRNEIAKI